MKRTIAFALSLLLMTATLTGCGRRGNVSTNEEGRITEDTTRTEAITKPTGTTVDPIPTVTTESEVELTTRNTEEPSVGSTSMTENTNVSSSDTEESSSNVGDNSKSRSRTGITGGKKPY